MRELDDENALARVTEAIAKLPRAAHSDCAGRGIVICGGGERYFCCAWVCVNILRRHGCVRPIELWHLGRRR